MELWASDPTQAVDTAAEHFYRETGFMAPGKSVPLEMCREGYDDDRRRAYEAWHRERRALRHATIREAADLLAGDAPEPERTTTKDNSNA